MSEFMFSSEELRNIELKCSVNRIMRIASLIPLSGMILKNNPLKKLVMKKPDVVDYEIYNIRKALLFSEDINEILSKFVKKLEEYPEVINTNTLYRNLKDLKVTRDEASFINKLEEKLNLIIPSGSYNSVNNSIFLNKKTGIDEHVLTHELIHLASSIRNSIIIFTGFKQVAPINGAIGMGVNEGSTEYINTLLFDYPLQEEGYPELTHLIRGITNIIGDKKLIELYFKNDLKGLIDEIAKYSDKKTANALVKGIDILYQLVYDSIFRNNKKVQELTDRLESLLEDLIINIYIKNQKELLKNKEITEEEYKDNIFKNVYAYQTNIFFEEVLDGKTNELAHMAKSKVQEFIIPEDKYKILKDNITSIFENPKKDKKRKKKEAFSDFVGMQRIIAVEKHKREKIERENSPEAINEKKRIKQLLIEIENDKTKILELEKFSIERIIKVALKEKLYDSLITIFKPIVIDGNVKIYFDAFSDDADMRYIINTALEEPPEKLGDGEDLIIIPKDIKEKIERELFTIDYDLISQIKIKDSHARRIAGVGNPIRSIEDVIYYSEPSCLKSNIDLYNKNIRTVSNDTECVLEDAKKDNGLCEIVIDYESLSEENKTIIKELIREGYAKETDGIENAITIYVPCSGEETVGEISQKLQDIISRFKHQDLLYGRLTLEEFVEKELENYRYWNPDTYDKYFPNAEGTWADVINFAQEMGYYYDIDEDVLWMKKEYYNRHKEYLTKSTQINTEK